MTVIIVNELLSGSATWLSDLHSHFIVYPVANFVLFSAIFLHTHKHVRSRCIECRGALWHEPATGDGRCHSNVPIKIEMMNPLNGKKRLTGQKLGQPANSVRRWHFRSVNKPPHPTADTWFISSLDVWCGSRTGGCTSVIHLLGGHNWMIRLCSGSKNNCVCSHCDFHIFIITAAKKWFLLPIFIMVTAMPKSIVFVLEMYISWWSEWGKK